MKQEKQSFSVQKGKQAILETEFKVKGFHCKSCEMLVKDVAQDFKEITSCKVDVKTGKVSIEHESGLNVAKFKSEIEELGDYKVI